MILINKLTILALALVSIAALQLVDAKKDEPEAPKKAHKHVTTVAPASTTTTAKPATTPAGSTSTSKPASTSTTPTAKASTTSTSAPSTTTTTSTAQPSTTEAGTALFGKTGKDGDDAYWDKINKDRELEKSLIIKSYLAMKDWFDWLKVHKMTLNIERTKKYVAWMEHYFDRYELRRIELIQKRGRSNFGKQSESADPQLEQDVTVEVPGPNMEVITPNRLRKSDFNEMFV